MVQAIMQETVPLWDVTVKEPMRPVIMGRAYKGSLTYIHKVKDNRNIYLFSNSSDDPIETEVTLRGRIDLEAWNPMNGQKQPVEQAQSQSKDGRDLTTVPLKLEPMSAMFFVEKP
jgi:hypothetical protein